jgi:hypothetical protein
MKFLQILDIVIAMEEMILKHVRLVLGAGQAGVT